MPIPFTCPHCGHQTDVAEQYAGQTGPCSNCGKPVTIPAQPGAGYGPPKKSSGGLSPLVIVLIVLGCMMVLCVPCLIALLLPAVQSAREAARRVSCVNNMKQIALAMHNYHDTYRCFPPAYIADENGRPMHSWRVLILPFLEQKPLYDQYDFDKPWDSPENQALADLIMNVYRCPSDAGGNDTDTNYVMIVGPNTISDGPGTVRIADFTDGTSNTIMIVEVTQSGIQWMEPRDLDFQDLGDTFGSAHPGVVNAAFCDGSVQSLSSSLTPEQVEGMATIDGGEEADPWGTQY